MTLLLIGLALWVVPHMFKRLAPAMAAGIPEKSRKMGVTVASFLSIVLMVIGYRAWQSDVFYITSTSMVHVNNLLMTIAVYLLASSGMKTRVAQYVRHPMLTGVLVWAIAHLMVTGDLASIVLFGTFAVWSMVAMVLESAQEPWIKPAPAPMGKEIGAVVGTVIVVGLAGMVHIWLGYHPFGG